MQRNLILLSNGSVPWFSIKKQIFLAKSVGFDGLEILPLRGLKKEIQNLSLSELSFIKSIHQSWRLDIGRDKEYRIPKIQSIFFTLLRLFLFPNINESNDLIASLSKKLNVPIIVHDLNPEWTKGRDKKEFSGGIHLEIIGEKHTQKDIKQWLTNKSHRIVIDTRDDQSLVWAQHHNFSDWKSFWLWIGFNNIKNVQLTLIGLNGMKKIKNHKPLLAEEQLLWLNRNNWKGSVTVEVNPLFLFLLYKGNFKKGLKDTVDFIKTTLLFGEKWS